MAETKDIVKAEEKSIEKTRELIEVTPAVDIFENDEEILLCADMPGVVKENISVNINNGTLSLSGVRELTHEGAVTWEEFGDIEYVRNFSIPQTIDIERVEAELKNGVLALHLPKGEAARPRQIEIRTV